MENLPWDFFCLDKNFHVVFSFNISYEQRSMVDICVNSTTAAAAGAVCIIRNQCYYFIIEFLVISSARRRGIFVKIVD